MTVAHSWAAAIRRNWRPISGSYRQTAAPDDIANATRRCQYLTGCLIRWHVFIFIYVSGLDRQTEHKNHSCFSFKFYPKGSWKPKNRNNPENCVCVLNLCSVLVLLFAHCSDNDTHYLGFPPASLPAPPILTPITCHQVVLTSSPSVQDNQNKPTGHVGPKGLKDSPILVVIMVGGNSVSLCVFMNGWPSEQCCHTETLSFMWEGAAAGGEGVVGAWYRARREVLLATGLLWLSIVRGERHRWFICLSVCLSVHPAVKGHTPTFAVTVCLFCMSVRTDVMSERVKRLRDERVTR